MIPIECGKLAKRIRHCHAICGICGKVGMAKYGDFSGASGVTFSKEISVKSLDELVRDVVKVEEMKERVHVP